MAMSDFLANKLLYHLNGVPFTPDDMHLALMLDEATEVSGLGYTRMSIAGKVSISGDTMSINQNIDFPVAIESWGLVTNIAVYSALTDGDQYFIGATNSARSVSSGEIYTLLANNFSIQLA